MYYVFKNGREFLFKDERKKSFFLGYLCLKELNEKRAELKKDASDEAKKKLEKLNKILKDVLIIFKTDMRETIRMGGSREEIIKFLQNVRDIYNAPKIKDIDEEERREQNRRYILKED